MMDLTMIVVEAQSADHMLTRKGVLLGRIEMLREAARAFAALTVDLPGRSSLGARPSPLEIAQAQQTLICAFGDWMRVELEEQLGELRLLAHLYPDKGRSLMP